MAERNKNLEKALGTDRLAIKGQISRVDTELIRDHAFQGDRGLCTHIKWVSELRWVNQRGQTCDAPREAHVR